MTKIHFIHKYIIYIEKDLIKSNEHYFEDIKNFLFNLFIFNEMTSFLFGRTSKTETFNAKNRY